MGAGDCWDSQTPRTPYFPPGLPLSSGPFWDPFLVPGTTPGCLAFPRFPNCPRGPATFPGTTPIPSGTLITVSSPACPQLPPGCPTFTF